MLRLFGIPFFIWFGVSGLPLLWAGGIVMLVAAKRRKPQLRTVHKPLVFTGLGLITIHALWAISYLLG